MPCIVHFHILVLVHVREVDVGHAQFLALINIGRAPHHVDHCGQHLRAAGPEQFAVIAIAADLARLVVVPKVHRIPGFSLQRGLPAVERRPHILQRRAVIAPLPEFGPVVQSVVMLKGEDHIQFRSVLVRIANRAVRGSAGLADGQQVVFVQHLAPHLPEIAVRCFRMHARGAEIAIQRSGRHRTVVEILLADHADDVHPPSVHAFVAPPAHHLKHAFPDFWICPVQIRLFFCEKMQVVLAAFFILLPGGSGEAGAPVVRRSAVLSVLPDVIIPVGIILSFPAFHKPGMLVGGVVCHQIHHQFHTPGMDLGKHPVEVFHRTEFLHDGPVIRNVVSVIMIR